MQKLPACLSPMLNFHFPFECRINTPLSIYLMNRFKEFRRKRVQRDKFYLLAKRGSHLRRKGQG